MPLAKRPTASPAAALSPRSTAACTTESKWASDAPRNGACTEAMATTVASARSGSMEPGWLSIAMRHARRTQAACVSSESCACRPRRFHSSRAWAAAASDETIAVYGRHGVHTKRRRTRVVSLRPSESAHTSSVARRDSAICSRASYTGGRPAAAHADSFEPPRQQAESSTSAAKRQTNLTGPPAPTSRRDGTVRRTPQSRGIERAG